jgi:hypothetical protein
MITILAIVHACIISAIFSIPAALWCLPLGLGGAPGALIAGVDQQGPRFIPGLFICVVGQTAVALIFAAFVLTNMEHFLVAHRYIVTWPYWVAAFLIGGAPVTMALKDASSHEAPNAQHAAVTFVGPLLLIGQLAMFFGYPDAYRVLPSFW